MQRPASVTTELWDLFAKGTRVSYQKGESIIRPGEEPPGAFLLVDGFVKSYDITKYGEENLLILREAGQVFPILWTMTDDNTHVFYKAVSDVTMLRISRKAYRDAIANQPAIKSTILNQVLDLYEIHSQRVINLGYRTAPERVAYRVIVLADRFGERTENGDIRIAAPTRHQDIAEAVNCSRETASRELSKLQKKGFIKSADGSFIIKDLSGLVKIVGTQEAMRERFKELHSKRLK